MKIFVKAKPGARENKVEQLPPDLWQSGDIEAKFVVQVKEPPIQGRANTAIAKALAEYFKVAPSTVKLVSGFSSKNKVFEIPD